jgi:hypothetical protein
MDEPTKTSVGRRLVLLILIGLGLLLLSAGVGWFAVDRLVIGRGSVTVPDSLAGLPLSERVTGRVALAEIERLHGKGFPLVNGTVVR